MNATSPQPTSQISTKSLIVVCLVLLALQSGMAVRTAYVKSPAHDEYWHLPVGLINLETGRFDVEPLNPPLLRMWSALPLTGRANVPEIDGKLAPDRIGDAFLLANPGSSRWFFAGRLMNVTLMFFGGLLTVLFARNMFGNNAALLTGILWATSPTLIGLGSLVTTDVGAAVGFVAIHWAVWSHARRPTFLKALLIGVLLGAAQAMKFTSLVLVVTLPAVWLVVRWRDVAVVPSRLWRVTIQVVLIAVLAGVVLNASYFFQGYDKIWGDLTFQSSAMQKIDAVVPQSLPLLVSADYLVGLDAQRAAMEAVHPTFLNGEWRAGPFRHYYLAALWYKLPHVLQLLFVIGLIRMLRRRDRRPAVWFLLIPSGLLLLLASFSNMQLGLRYLLPIFPLLLIVAGAAASDLDYRTSKLSFAVVTLLGLLAFASPRYHPHHFAYFNEWAGGPVGGHHHLVDSNIDWGQDLALLSDFARERGLTDMPIAYFGTVPPALFQLSTEVPPKNSVVPGWYAVSVSVVEGRPFTARVMKDDTVEGINFNVGELSYFQFFEPVARLGYSIYVYHITQDDVQKFYSGQLGSR